MGFPAGITSALKACADKAASAIENFDLNATLNKVSDVGKGLFSQMQNTCFKFLSQKVQAGECNPAEEEHKELEEKEGDFEPGWEKIESPRAHPPAIQIPKQENLYDPLSVLDPYPQSPDPGVIVRKMRYLK